MASREGVHGFSSYEGFSATSSERQPFDYDSFYDIGSSVVDQSDVGCDILSFADHLKIASWSAKVIPFPSGQRGSSTNVDRTRSRASRSARTSRVRSENRRFNSAFESAYNHVVVIVSLSLLLVALLVVVANSFTGVNVSKTSYVVQPGDTIYSIASRFSNGGSVNQLEYQLMQEVHGTVIVPGQTLTIG